MFYSEEDMIKITGNEGNTLTPFESTTCRAMAFGDNLALSVTFDALTEQVERAYKELIKNIGTVPEEQVEVTHNAMTTAMLMAMSSVIVEE